MNPEIEAINKILRELLAVFVRFLGERFGEEIRIPEPEKVFDGAEDWDCVWGFMIRGVSMKISILIPQDISPTKFSIGNLIAKINVAERFVKVVDIQSFASMLDPTHKAILTFEPPCGDVCSFLR